MTWKRGIFEEFAGISGFSWFFRDFGRFFGLNDKKGDESDEGRQCEDEDPVEKTLLPRLEHVDSGDEQVLQVDVLAERLLEK